MSIFIHSIRPERRVEPGFCWAALLFGTIWAYSEGLIVQGGRLVSVDGVAGLLLLYGVQSSQSSPIGGALLLFLAKNFYCAIRGRRWLRSLLFSQGYREVIQ
ncbi:hypothetical protein [Ralstonia pseudosolanacearum]|uniref:hypothetical protein n=1 Tax=Ralstonia pseudosolanacearum TaxID=1310165 RepID=UPI001E45AB39|nr:hypothetical protein [Ralstonia pseudosolanacearum]